MWNTSDDEVVSCLTLRFGKNDISPPPFTYYQEPNKGMEITPGTTIGTVRFGISVGTKDVHYCTSIQIRDKGGSIVRDKKGTMLANDYKELLLSPTECIVSARWDTFYNYAVNV